METKARKQLTAKSFYVVRDSIFGLPTENVLVDIVTNKVEKSPILSISEGYTAGRTGRVNKFVFMQDFYISVGTNIECRSPLRKKTISYEAGYLNKGVLDLLTFKLAKT